MVTSLATGDRRLRIGDTVDGRVSKVLPYIGVLVDIGVGYDVLLPIEHYGKKLKRPRVGYEVAYLEILDVDPDAIEEYRKIILGAEDCINLTPSPLLITPDSSCRASLQSSPRASFTASPGMLSPLTSYEVSPQPTPLQLSPLQSQLTSPQSSPTLQARNPPPAESLDSFQLDAYIPASETLGDSVSWRRDIPICTFPYATGTPVAKLRQTLLDKADEFGVAQPQLVPILRSLDALELRMYVLDKAHELGIDQSQLAPVLKSINDLPKKIGTASNNSKSAKTPVPKTGRCWRNRSSANKAAQAA